MSDVLGDVYWTDEFGVTAADLDRIARYIRDNDQAQDLSTLIKRVVSGQLLYGPDDSVLVTSSERGTDAVVRSWDPAGQWQPGDSVLIWTLSHQLGHYTVMTGEVTAVTYGAVEMGVDDVVRPIRRFTRVEPGSSVADRWRRRIQKAIAEKRAKELAVDDPEFVELVLLEHGDNIAGKVLQALREDKRFVLLDGRWFLRELAVLPSDEQIEALAWFLLAAPEPQSTEALFSQFVETAATGDADLFGLYLALRQRPELFGNTEPGKRPLWKVVRPPPGSFVPQRAAYDPESYEILCVPGETARAEVVTRLWEIELLTAVV